MNDGLRLVGAVAAVRIQGALLLGVSLASCVPAFLDGPNRLDPVAGIGTAALLFVSTFCALLKLRRPWYETRLARLTPPPATAEPVAPDRTFDLLSRTLTVPLLLVLAIGIGIGAATGVPAGMFLAGLAAAMLWQSRWLAAEEKRHGGRLLCPYAPFRVAPDDPHAAAYRESRFWIVREPSADLTPAS
ncbi:hypothetical protein [Streptomyces sp. Y1]|uniref:Integral membrane protein n=1 Tax=Streptomyces sp. Y1 TaxID=3238634 RepID=A0AB39TUN0_9ACTN